MQLTLLLAPAAWAAGAAPNGELSMSVRNLDVLFHPRSIALVGASKQPRSVGAVLARNLLAAGFDGPVMPVNPHEIAIARRAQLPSVAGAADHARSRRDRDAACDRAAASSPSSARAACRAAWSSPRASARRARQGARASAGDARRGAGRILLRIVGPNCLGFMSPGARPQRELRARQAPPPGEVAFVTQSGAVLTAVLDWATRARHRLQPHVVSLGDMADVDFGDLLDYLAPDRHTRAILLYVESVTDARKFMSAAACRRALKPVDGGQGRPQQRRRKGGAVAHAARSPASDRVYDAAFPAPACCASRRCASCSPRSRRSAAACASHGDRLAILTNGGGIGVLATDA